VQLTYKPDFGGKWVKFEVIDSICKQFSLTSSLLSENKRDFNISLKMLSISKDILNGRDSKVGDASFPETSLPEQLSDWLQVASAINWLMWILGLGVC
jgi:hypothetical protein